MKKRLRKKRHLAEFQALGFYVTGTLDDALDDAKADRLLDDWIEFIESRGLVCGGGFGPFDARPRGLSFYLAPTVISVILPVKRSHR